MRNTATLTRTKPPRGGFFMPKAKEPRMTHDTEADNLDVHVAVCAERYKSLEMRLDRIERVMWWMLSTLIIALGGMLLELLVLLSGRIL